MEKLLNIHREWPDTDWEVFHGRFCAGGDELQLQHLPYREMTTIADISDTENFFKFTIVRNPWERLASEYFWTQSNLTMAFRDFAQMVADIVANRRKIKGSNCHFRPQVEFLDAELDDVLRFERFESDVRRLLKRWNVEVDELPRFGVTGPYHYQDLYDSKSIQIVAEIYEEDVKRLEYDFSD